jgi:puromycin-sensitive aminopeptidase
MTALDLTHDDNEYRLPNNVVPNRYDVTLRPDLDNATFAGDVTIRLDVQQASDTIVLNAIELDIEHVSVDDQVATWMLDADTERLIITVAKPLTRPSAKLFIRYTGVLNDKLRGFYRSTYVDDAGVEHVIATTQMQATDCRRAFPCWDEPEYKAVFGITLDVAEGLAAISNGTELERVAGDGRTVIRFADTMPMSSYLVAFVVGELAMTEPLDVDGVPLRIVHVPGKAALTQFGMDVGAFCLRWFQTYYGIPYPSDKVDLVGLPDFAAGAMENLGCITFRENLLLIDPNTSTQHERQLVADVVAHELAHMWFGDLVTMRWWNGIWLNEAFATFMEIAACDAFAPEWARWTDFGLERSTAFEVDSLASTRSVEFEVHSPADCEGMFDVLTYQKGGALLRMLEQYLGADKFRAGVSHYLRTHSYSNTETNDLWDAIETTSGEPVRRIMDSWIWQPGFPLVSAELETKGGRTHLVLSQRRFSYPSAGATPIDDRAAWVIPVHIRNGSMASTVLIDSIDPVVIELTDPDDVVIVNANGHGFYRVAYSPELRARLADRAAMTHLDTLERYSLVDDAWAATVAGRMSANDLLDVLDGFVDEREYGVWQAIAIALNGLSRLVEGDALAALRVRVQRLAAPTLDSLGSPTASESDLTAKLRGLLTRTMGALGAHADTITRCRELLQRSRNGDIIDAELLAASTTVVATHGGVADYEAMLTGFTHASTPQDQLRHLYALAEFNDPDLVLRTCEFAMSDAVKSQNAPFVLRTALANRNHGRRAWEFVRDHWDDATARFPDNTHARMIDAVKLLTAPDVVADVQSFFTAHPIEQAAKTLEQILERQRVNAAFVARDGADFAGALLHS